MLYWKNGSVHHNSERCCQCGTCLASCPAEALTARRNDDGTYRISCDTDKCIKCGKCTENCPASDLPKYRLNEDTLYNIHDVLLGYCNDFEIRNRASSGGVARMIIKNAVESHFCQSAYCVVSAERYPWAEGAYLSGLVQLNRIPNSMYLPILVNANLGAKSVSGRLLAVGTNCQLLGIEKFFKDSSVELIKVCLLCKQQKTLGFTRYASRFLKADIQGPTKYRGDGWPGSLSIGDRSVSWRFIASLPYDKRLWLVPGCKYCGHLLGANADITLADPWNVDLPKTVEGGATLIMVRTAKGRELLEACKQDISLYKINPTVIKRSIAWRAYKSRLNSIDYYLGRSVGPWHNIGFTVAHYQRRLYEFLLDRWRFPAVALRILDKIPFYG